MVVLIAQMAEVAFFLGTSVVLGVLLRRRPTQGFAEALSRVSHLAFWIGLAVPWPIGLFYPGSATLDRLIGVSALPLPLWVRRCLREPPAIHAVPRAAPALERGPLTHRASR